MNRRIRGFFVCLGLFVLVAGRAGASLIGDEVLGMAEFSSGPGVNLFDGGFGGGSEPLMAVVGSDVEFWSGPLGGGAHFAVNLDESSIFVTWHTERTVGMGADFHVWLDDLDWMGVPDLVISEVVLVSSDFEDTSVSWTDRGVHITLGNQVWYSGKTMTAHFALTPQVFTPLPSDVPEPSTVVLIGMGLACVAYRERRRFLG